MFELDVILFGLDIFNVYILDEYISIFFVVNNWGFFIDVMKGIKELVK